MNIKNLKESIDLEGLLSYFGFSYTETPNHFKMLCPFHQENTPSFFFEKKTKLFHCFGCGIGGDVIKFVQLLENLDFNQTLSFLKDFSIGIPFDEKAIYRKSESSIVWPNSFLKISKDLFPDYLIKRGITLETALFFNLAICFKGKFKNRIIVPIYFRKKLVGYLGRSIDNSPLRYLNYGAINNFLFNYDEAKKFKEVFVVEGVFDLFKLFQNGIKNAVATFGKSITPLQHLWLNKFDKLHIIPDNNDKDNKTLVTALNDFNYDVIFVNGKKDVGDLPNGELYKFLLSPIPKSKQILNVRVRA